KDDCKKNIQRISEENKQFAAKLENNSAVKNVRTTGTILALDFKTSEQTSYFNSLRDEVYKYFLDEGIILRPLGNTIYIMPHYCISDDDIIYIYTAIEKRAV